MKPTPTLPVAFVSALLLLIMATPFADAEETTAEDLEKVKQRYWAQGNESEMGVVQNRLYTKEGRIETSLLTGMISSDPFLDITSFGASVGYHFNETFSTHLFGWKNHVTASSALQTLRDGGKQANTNEPNSAVGIEARSSLLYGKLSLVGKKILYYDMHAGLGIARTQTENGAYFGPLLSVGQNIYLARSLSFRVDYRLLGYREEIFEKQITAKLGQSNGMRNNFAHSITFGVSFFWGGAAP